MSASIQFLAGCVDSLEVGAKAANLGRLIREGFPVPTGFVITQTAQTLNGSLDREVVEAWHSMGSPPVAVRSSAAEEDGSAASMAGQFETILNVDREEDLIAAVARCRESLHGHRAGAYRLATGTSKSGGMGVIVQQYVAPDVAGVLFTADPESGNEESMICEAVAGSGDELVSGRAEPQQWRIDRGTASDFPKKGLLNDEQVQSLWQIGCRIAGSFGCPQDIEWAIRGDELTILQTRPITTRSRQAARELRIAEIRDELRWELGEGNGPWALHNISETLPAPTPLTWSIIDRFLSSRGGFGGLYRELGVNVPEGDCRLTRLIAGRVYTDLARAPEMLGLSSRYDLELLRRDPMAAQGLPTLQPSSLLDRWAERRRIRTLRRRIRKLELELDHEYGTLIPAFREWCETEKRRSLAELDADRWLELWREREHRIFDAFAPRMLLATLVSAEAMSDLRQYLAESFWDEDPDELTTGLLAGESPDVEDLRRLGRGEWSMEQWLERHGHRAPEEMELASPRWRERPGQVREMASKLAVAGRNDPGGGESARGPSGTRALDVLVERCRRFISWRERGRHELLRGYDLLRDLALEAGKRLGLGDDVFLLTPEEIASSLRSEDAASIRSRKDRRALERGVFVPPLVGVEDLESLGDLPEPSENASFRGLGVSAGAAAGRARLPDSGPVRKGDVIVCGTLDPNLTPQFLDAAAVVVETGGLLSHGAIVAREMHLPVVVLPGAIGFFREGERLAVDGSRGTVSRLDAGENAGRPSEKCLLPPPPGPFERLSAQIRNSALAIWGLYFAALLLLPHAWLYEPSLAILDRVLWPLVKWADCPGAVAIIAGSLALILAVMQRALTDVPRLREAKARARARSKAGNQENRREAAEQAVGVQVRLFCSACVAPAVLLGPLVMILLWIPHRLDSTNPAPGSGVSIAATIQSDFREPVTLETGPGLAIDSATPVSQIVPPIRETLESLLKDWRPEEFADAGSKEDLEGYLRRGVPPQRLLWKVFQTVPDEGRFRVRVTAGHSGEGTAVIAFGDRTPPASVFWEGRGVVCRMEVIAPSSVARTFWKPLRFLGVDWDAGWLGIYLVTYLMASFLLGRLLRLP